MTFYTKSLDCGKLMADSYTNTAYVSAARNHTASFINLRWGNDVNPQTAVIEFYNYYSILPMQEARTFTTRGSFGMYPQTSPDLQIPLAAIIAVPPFAQRFRVRFQGSGPFVSNFVPVRNNGMYYIEGGRILEVYDF